MSTEAPEKAREDASKAEATSSSVMRGQGRREVEASVIQQLESRELSKFSSYGF